MRFDHITSFGHIPSLRPPPSPVPPAHIDPDFVRAADWLAAGSDDPAAVVVGVPYAGGSLSKARCDTTPAAIRTALARFSVWSSSRAISLTKLAVADAGDIECPTPIDEAQATIEQVVAAIGPRPVALLGGDNSITVGGVRGTNADALITLDAHHDCRTGLSNGSPVRQLIEGGLTTVVQMGINGFANAEAHGRWALDHKVHIVLADRVRADGMTAAVKGALRLCGRAERIFVDFDIDVLDRAFAPAAAASMPGGLTPPQIQEAAFLFGHDKRVVGMDITELDASSDVNDITVRTACSVLLEFLAGVASR